MVAGRLQVASDVDRRLADLSDLDRLLRDVTGAARELSDAESCAVCLVHREWRGLYWTAASTHRGWPHRRRAILCVPLRTRRLGTIGVVEAARRGHFTARHRERLEVLAGDVGVACEKAMLSERIGDDVPRRVAPLAGVAIVIVGLVRLVVRIALKRDQRTRCGGTGGVQHVIPEPGAHHRRRRRDPR